MSRKSIYRKVLMLILFVSIVATGIYSYRLLKDSIPNNIKILAGTEQEFEFNVPSDAIVYEESAPASVSGKSNIPSNQLKIDASNTLTLSSSEVGNYTVKCKLFGIFELKNINVDVINQRYLIPGGVPIGIYMETDGVLVIGTGVVNGTDGLNYEPAYNIVQSGDYIISVNSEIVENKNELIEKINQYGNEDLTLQVRRRNEIIELNVEPVLTGPNEHKIGVWVRDNTQGIGTLTYIDNNNNFGALGHGINDIDTSELMSLKTGKLYNTDIISIVKGIKGTPGELAGVIRYNDSEIIGDISSNTASGIFGTLSSQEVAAITNEPKEICLKQDIQLGEATILSSVDGTLKEYTIDIQEVHLNDNDANKGLVIQVTDPVLLELTGGIVQGMSGSPILQNGKIVGAVTHVFIQDSTRGFGIFIENMINSQE